MGLALGALLVAVLYEFVGTVVFGLFLYYAARPIYDRLEPRVRPTNLAVAAALFVLVLPVILLFWYTAALALGELRALAAVDLADYERLLAPYLDEDATVEDLGAVVTGIATDPLGLLQTDGLRSVLGTAGGLLTALLGGLFRLFVALALAFYLLRDDERLAAWIRDTADDEILSAYGHAVDRDLQTVFFGNILLAIITGVVAAGTFLALDAVAPAGLGVPVPVLIGLLAGAASLVPVVGMKIVYGPVAVYLTVLAVTTEPESVWFPAVFVVVTGVVVDLIPDIVLRPYVSGRHLHVGLVLLAYVFGPLLFGWYGLFLGPLLLVLGVHFARIVIPELIGDDDDPVDADQSTLSAFDVAADGED